MDAPSAYQVIYLDDEPDLQLLKARGLCGEDMQEVVQCCEYASAGYQAVIDRVDDDLDACCKDFGYIPRKCVRRPDLWVKRRRTLLIGAPVDYDELLYAAPQRTVSCWSEATWSMAEDSFEGFVDVQELLGFTVDLLGSAQDLSEGYLEALQPGIGCAVELLGGSIRKSCVPHVREGRKAGMLKPWIDGEQVESCWTCQ